MKFNYRVLAYKDGDDWFYQIHEVYYNKKGEPTSYTKNGVSVNGNSKKDLKWVLRKMKQALKKPIIIEKNFPKTFKDLKKDELQ